MNNINVKKILNEFLSNISTFNGFVNIDSSCFCGISNDLNDEVLPLCNNCNENNFLDCRRARYEGEVCNYDAVTIYDIILKMFKKSDYNKLINNNIKCECSILNKNFLKCGNVHPINCVARIDMVMKSKKSECSLSLSSSSFLNKDKEHKITNKNSLLANIKTYQLEDF